MAADLRWEFTDSPKADDLDAVDAGLHLYNLAAAELDAVRPLACFVRTASGEVVGGLRARQWGAAVEVQQLWVDESRRRQGLGARLMQMLEQHARSRGAQVIYLDTFTFQAPGFYEGCGFRPAARIDGFPQGIARFLMVKRLDAVGSGG
jgi:ribosomal protein S18 acetylase RimI-like enzyme